jgi:hypothetical protein
MMKLPERSVPTLWPPSLNDEVRMRAAFEVLEKENKLLKDLVIRLTETVLKSVACQK